jgi:lysophospholipase L1-like esterase
MTKKSIVLIGDSIRMGYQDHVARELADQVEIWAPEQNGGDSRNVLAHLDEWVISRAPDLVHVNCGLHDLKRAFGEGQNVPLEEYGHNVRQILAQLQSDFEGVVVWAQTTPVDEKLHHQNKGFDRFEADVDAYNEVARSVAVGLGVPVDDLFAVVEREGKARLLTPDGVHFTEEGSQILGRAVATCVREHLEI